MPCSQCFQIGHNRRNPLCPVNVATRTGQSSDRIRGLEILQRLIRLRDSINARILLNSEDQILIQLRATLNNVQANLEDIVIPVATPALPAAFRRHYPLNLTPNKKMVTITVDTANIEEDMLLGIQPTECPICYENACSVTTGCNHGFCHVCVQSQFIASKNEQTNPKCALCRKEICKLTSTSGRIIACLEEFMKTEKINARVVY